ncbi:MAG: efflux RND transporter periplasmic adaptor subunit [Verrucomicrobiota bacterium]
MPVRFEDNYSTRKSFVGTIETRRQSNLGFELAGTLDFIHFDEGDPIQQGTILARLDTSRLQARQQEIEASLTENSASLRFSQSVFDRNRELIKTRAVSQEEFENSRQQLDLNRARETQLLAQKRAVLIDIKKSELIAPYSGTLAERHQDEGATVTTGQPVFTLLETGVFQIRAPLPHKVAENVAKSGSAQIRFPDNSRHQLPLTRILPQTNRETRTRDLIFTLPSEFTSVRDGDLVAIEVTSLQESRGFWLPLAALTEAERGLWACFVASPDPGQDAHQLDLRTLQLLYAKNKDVFVNGTVREGELIVSSGLDKLSAGQRVKINSDN